MKWNNPDLLRIKGHWRHLFWKFWYCDLGTSPDFIPLVFGICWERNMTLRKKIACELDLLRNYIYKNMPKNEYTDYAKGEIQRMECELYGRNIF